MSDAGLFSSIPEGDVLVGRTPHIVATCVVLVVLPALGYAFLWAMRLVVGDVAPGNMLVALSMLLFYSPSFAWAGLVAGIPAAIWGLKLGRAGVGSAILVGALIGALVLSLARGPGAVFAGALFGLGFGAAYWGVLRAMRPRAFGTAETPPT